MKKIGILGGMGPQASVKLYELLIEGTKRFTPAEVDDDFPEIVVINVPTPNFISNEENLQKAEKMLVARAQLLEQAGCTVNGIACNTAHIMLPKIQASTKVPFLAIPQLVAQKAQTAGFTRIGLLATPATLGSTLYDDALKGITGIIRPSQSMSIRVEGLIYKQINGTIEDVDKKSLQKLVSDFMRIQKLDAVILGCTELPLIFGKSDTPKIIDTLQLLADALLEEYFKDV